MALLQVLDPVARAIGDAEFGDPTADRFDVARIAGSKSVNPDEAPGRRPPVLQLAQPSIERRGPHDVNHVSTVVHDRHDGEGLHTLLQGAIPTFSGVDHHPQWERQPPPGITAEGLGVDEIATVDLRHVTVVCPAHVDAFTLLP